MFIKKFEKLLSSILISPITYHCNKCNMINTIFIDYKKLDFIYTSSYIKGDSKEYRYDSENIVNCNNCRGANNIVFKFYEYPLGNCNYLLMFVNKEAIKIF